MSALTRRAKARMGNKTPRSQHASRSKSDVDHLTDRERAIVKARIENPGASLDAIGKIVGVPGKKQARQKEVCEALKRPQVRVALAHPPPTVTGSAIDENGVKVDLDDPVAARRWLKGWYMRIVADPATPQSERIRALNAVAEMTPGAKVPVGVHHTGAWTLEKFVEAAGGKPPDVPKTAMEDLPN